MRKLKTLMILNSIFSFLDGFWRSLSFCILLIARTLIFYSVAYILQINGVAMTPFMKFTMLVYVMGPIVSMLIYLIREFITNRLIRGKIKR